MRKRENIETRKYTEKDSGRERDKKNNRELRERERERETN